MREQVMEFSQWAPNINVKIPIHGPNGEIENIQLIHEFETRLNVRINVTAMMSAQQCFVAAMAGATYVSLFCGRINDMGYDSCVEIEKLRKMLNSASLPAQIIAASCREAVNVEQWFGAGAHIVTVQPEILLKMIVHPYSKETVQQFIRDGAKFEEQAKVQQHRLAS
jgi:transaldolase